MTSKRRLVADRAARWLVAAGGLAIIAGILGILVFISVEIAPLFRGARVSPDAALPFPAGGEVAIVIDEHRSHVASLSTDGWFRVVRLEDGRAVVERRLEERFGRLTAVRAEPGEPLLTAATERGQVLALDCRWTISFDGSTRVVEPVETEPVVFFEDGRGPLELYSARLDEEGGGAAAAWVGGSLVVERIEARRGLLEDLSTLERSRHEATAPADLSVLLLDGDRREILGGTRSGRLVSWNLGEDLAAPETVPASSSAVTALSLLLGDRALAVGHEDGTLVVWFDVRVDGTPRLTRIRELGRHPSAITLIAPSSRGRGLMAQDREGTLGLYHSTSERVLWQGRSPLEGATSLAIAPKSDAAYLAGPHALARVALDNPHPEISWRAFFGRVWYEGYEERDFVWQSSGGSDEFEPKLSLVPLMVGTLKGTVYSLILAIPLGVFGAMFASQFMNPSLRKFVKPTVEIMAALPSVVLGFLAGLWLAPRLEGYFTALLLMTLAFPLLILATWWLMRVVAPVRQRAAKGGEVLTYMLVLAAGAWAALAVGPRFETLLFGGDFQTWLLEATGLGYDQRNAVVVGLAMGFAVIPVIFAIAEDAFTNVPRTLVSGSLALGASRWQTVTRVVLPTASPGIFSAVMIGFGRAIGETMIVLMATGNTPLLDWSPFNGFRTLSANIAVEIPEAPHGGTLYRTLFLAAMLLFLFTFAVNTAAEVIRQRLRRRYAQI